MFLTSTSKLLNVVQTLTTQLRDVMFSKFSSVLGRRGIKDWPD
jgi:hypothetical protein